MKQFRIVPILSHFSYIIARRNTTLSMALLGYEGIRPSIRDSRDLDLRFIIAIRMEYRIHSLLCVKL